MLHIVESRKSLDEVAKDLEAAVTRHKFGVLGIHDLKATMAKKGVEFARECRIFEVCNPHQAKKVLEEAHLGPGIVRDAGAEGRRSGGGGHARGDHGRRGPIG